MTRAPSSSNNHSRNLPTLSLSCLLLLISCTSQPTPALIAKQPVTVARTYPSLRGTWVRHGKVGFTLIEIQDTAHAIYCTFADRKSIFDTITHNRFYYDKAKVSMGLWHQDSTQIWLYLAKEGVRLDYRVQGDTLVEYDKMGPQNYYTKVQN